MVELPYGESDRQAKQREAAFLGRPITECQRNRQRDIREVANDLACMMNFKCPESRELSLAQTNLEQAVMWALAAIERNEKTDGE